VVEVLVGFQDLATEEAEEGVFVADRGDTGHEIAAFCSFNDTAALGTLLGPFDLHLSASLCF
jgi:hypothetical protein